MALTDDELLDKYIAVNFPYPVMMSKHLRYMIKNSLGFSFYLTRYRCRALAREIEIAMRRSWIKNVSDKFYRLFDRFEGWAKKRLDD